MKSREFTNEELIKILDALLLKKDIGDENIRVAVAEQGYGLDVLVNDKDWFVRRAVAEQGYGLDRLVNDESEDVRQAAKEAQNTTKTESTSK